ncbi:hypothetical protein CYLTODRAFT_146047 [Cylindrobasidium torrendii FP15055 ss-10]|uniref:Uncharacterized protein n=1 Tax=Cylindrobasidium torrendii FP15055 ss-10 TaxID=1314674 RepID=A0A0D7AZ48_9AGAR|nr:hypothetical protein CYLTODRAFT_146047 [Cylindrobasidium torrendii FP15055 ss-10]
MEALDIVTYRFQQTLVYVRPELSYDDAIAVAQTEYPELSATPKEKIMFKIEASMNGKRQPVRISRSAWASTLGKMLRGEVIDIEVFDDRPPQYGTEYGKSHMQGETSGLQKRGSQNRFPWLPFLH